MADAALELPLDIAGQPARVRACPDDQGGWNVSTEVEGRAIASDYCPDWRSVERFHARMQQWLRAAVAMKGRLSPA